MKTNLSLQFALIVTLMKASNGSTFSEPYGDVGSQDNEIINGDNGPDFTDYDMSNMNDPVDIYQNEAFADDSMLDTTLDMPEYDMADSSQTYTADYDVSEPTETYTADKMDYGVLPRKKCRHQDHAHVPQYEYITSDVAATTPTPELDTYDPSPEQPAYVPQYEYITSDVAATTPTPELDTYDAPLPEQPVYDIYEYITSEVDPATQTAEYDIYSPPEAPCSNSNRDEFSPQFDYDYATTDIAAATPTPELDTYDDPSPEQPEYVPQYEYITSDVAATTPTPELDTYDPSPEQPAYVPQYEYITSDVAATTPTPELDTYDAPLPEQPVYDIYEYITSEVDPATQTAEYDIYSPPEAPCSNSNRDEFSPQFDHDYATTDIAAATPTPDLDTYDPSLESLQPAYDSYAQDVDHSDVIYASNAIKFGNIGMLAILGLLL